MAKVKKDPYQEFLKQDFNQLFETLSLTDRQCHYLRSRWLDQILWMEGRAAYNRNWHYRLRLTAIVGGVIVPILISLNDGQSNATKVFKYLTVSLSGMVAATTAVEEFFHYGERWYHYRRTVESLKAQGWHFFELTGPYKTYYHHPKGHQAAFLSFADQVEEIIESDVDFYITQLTKEKKQGSALEDRARAESLKPDDEVL